MQSIHVALSKAGGRFFSESPLSFVLFFFFFSLPTIPLFFASQIPGKERKKILPTAAVVPDRCGMAYLPSWPDLPHSRSSWYHFFVFIPKNALCFSSIHTASSLYNALSIFIYKPRLLTVISIVKRSGLRCSGASNSQKARFRKNPKSYS